MQELNFQVIIDKDLRHKIEGVVAFGQFSTVEPRGTPVYGIEGVLDFYRDLIFGRPFPLTLVTRGIDNLGVLFAITLFLHRDLAIHPSVPGLLASVTLVDAFGTAGLAHVDRDLARFLRFLRVYTGSAAQQGRKAQEESLAASVGWLRAYVLEGALPALPSEKELPRVMDRGTDGYVVATNFHPDLMVGWEELFRMGFLRGVLMYQKGSERWSVVAARKSPYLNFDLQKAASALNQAEAAMGEPEGWATDGLWLQSPAEGTLILPSAMWQLFLRI